MQQRSAAMLLAVLRAGALRAPARRLGRRAATTTSMAAEHFDCPRRVWQSHRSTPPRRLDWLAISRGEARRPSEGARARRSVAPRRTSNETRPRVDRSRAPRPVKRRRAPAQTWSSARAAAASRRLGARRSTAPRSPSASAARSAARASTSAACPRRSCTTRRTSWSASTTRRSTSDSRRGLTSPPPRNCPRPGRGVAATRPPQVLGRRRRLAGLGRVEDRARQLRHAPQRHLRPEPRRLGRDQIRGPRVVQERQGGVGGRRDVPRPRRIFL